MATEQPLKESAWDRGIPACPILKKLTANQGTWLAGVGTPKSAAKTVICLHADAMS